VLELPTLARQREATSAIERPILMAWNQRDLHVCVRVLDEMPMMEKSGEVA
jgi:hypothetical protein